MKKIILLLMLLAASHAIAAPKQNQVITHIEHAYENVRTIKTDFVQHTKILSLDKIVKDEGTLFIKKPHMFRMDYSDRIAKQYVSDGEKIWSYILGDSQAEVYTLESEPQLKEAVDFLNGFNEISKKYKIESVESSTKRIKLELIPKNGKAPFWKLDTTFDPTTYLLTEIAIYRKNGGLTTYSFRNIELNPPLADDEFEFRVEGITLVQ